MTHAAQLSVASVELVPALKEPGAHVSHVRSLLALAAVLVKVPAPHAALTGAHASPLSTAENVEPATQPAHWRSADAVPSTARPEPTAHVAHDAQLSVASVELVPALNVPGAHAAHVRSLLAVAAAVV